MNTQTKTNDGNQTTTLAGSAPNVSVIFGCLMGFAVIFIIFMLYWSGQIRADETSLARQSGLFERMDKAGIASISRKDELLVVVLRDGQSLVHRACAWNDDVDRIGGCTHLTSSVGRAYKLVGGEAVYRGDAHEQGDSSDYILSRLSSDVSAAEKMANKARVDATAVSESWSAVRSFQKADAILKP